jgi:hypothetical protein
MNTSNGNSKSPGSAGGGEVFRAFTTNGTCVITEDFIKKVEEIAAIESKTDFYRTTVNGTRFHNIVEEQIQVHMDAYCKGHKSRFKGELYKDAKDHIEVYVKLMYYVQRGLITSFEDQGEKFINASWGEISKFCFVLFCFCLARACLSQYIRISSVKCYKTYTYIHTFYYCLGATHIPEIITATKAFSTTSVRVSVICSYSNESEKNNIEGAISAANLSVPLTAIHSSITLPTGTQLFFLHHISYDEKNVLLPFIVLEEMQGRQLRDQGRK